MCGVVEEGFGLVTSAEVWFMWFEARKSFSSEITPEVDYIFVLCVGKEASQWCVLLVRAGPGSCPLTSSHNINPAGVTCVYW